MGERAHAVVPITWPRGYQGYGAELWGEYVEGEPPPPPFARVSTRPDQWILIERMRVFYEPDAKNGQLRCWWEGSRDADGVFRPILTHVWQCRTIHEAERAFRGLDIMLDLIRHGPRQPVRTRLDVLCTVNATLLSLKPRNRKLDKVLDALGLEKTQFYAELERLGFPRSFLQLKRGILNGDYRTELNECP